MKIKFALSAAIIAAMLTAPANAQTSLVTPAEGYVYYNRERATLAAHDEELRHCLDQASLLVQPDPSAGAGGGGGLIGALVVGVMRGVMQSQAQRRGVVANTTNCMMLKGWRLVRVDESLGAEMAAREQAQIAERLSPWIGAEIPQGEIIRQFSNEIALTEAIAWGPAGDLDKIPLSIQALAPLEPPSAADAAPSRAARGPRHRFAGPLRALRERDLAELTPESTLIVVRIAGTNRLGGTTIGFSRFVEQPLADIESRGFAANLTQPAFATSSEPRERTMFFLAPPGRWRINSMGHTLWSTSFCWGAPTFEVAAGEVVFLDFNLLESRVPSFSTQAANTHLSTAPAHIAARARGASFVNGQTFQCGGSSAFYAYEIPGAPYADDYQVGSRAPHLRAAAVAVEAESLPLGSMNATIGVPPTSETAPAEPTPATP